MGRGRFKFFVPEVLPPGYTPAAKAPDIIDENMFKYVPPPLIDPATTAGNVKTDEASKIVSWSEDRTAQTDYHFIGVDTTAQPVTITLPRGADIPSGKILLIKDEGGNASNNAITVTTNDGSTIDGNAGVSLVADYASISVYFNGTGWHIY